jgi:hypothetical protein
VRGASRRGEREGEPWGVESLIRGHTSYPASDVVTMARSCVLL